MRRLPGNSQPVSLKSIPLLPSEKIILTDLGGRGSELAIQGFVLVAEPPGLTDKEISICEESCVFITCLPATVKDTDLNLSLPFAHCVALGKSLP